MTRIAIIIGSTRPGRRAEAVARWVDEVARRHSAVMAGDATVELVDLAAYGLPLLDEPIPAVFGQYRNAPTASWAATIAGFDGFIFVTPEYNHSVPAALKNAIDFLFAEWNHKAAGFVSYGVDGGIRAVEHLRLALAELKVADVRTQVALSVFADFEPSDPTDPDAPRVLSVGDEHESAVTTMLDELIGWSRALAPLRAVAADARSHAVEA